MRRNYEESWQRRLYIISSLVIIGAIALGLRLFQKQVLESPQYKAQAQRQQITQKEIPAVRGRIFAKEEYDESFPVAVNVARFRVMVIPKIVRNPREVAKTLAPVIEMNESEIYDKMNNKKPYLPPFKKRLSKEEAEKIAEKKITGVLLVPESQRYYPEEDLGGEVLGFVDAEGNGRYGLEGFYEEALKGYEGLLLAKRDQKGRYTAILGRKKIEQNGADLTLTLEHNVQFKARETLAAAMEQYKAEKGSVVVTDIKTGGILAMASMPSYDPNQFNQVAKDKPELFRNPAVSEAWEPGSIMKPFTMAAALDKGLVEPETEEVFGNSVTVQGFEIFTAQKKAFGRETMTQVLENSDNVAMVWVADKLGNEAMYRYLKSFGLGEKSGVDLQGEASGTIPELRQWRDIHRATLSFGQGMAATPLQVVMAYGAIANKGVLLKPYLVDTIKRSDGSEVKAEKKEVRQVLKAETAKQMTDMLISVVERGHGKKAGVPGYWVAGKTGTAQIPKPGGGYYEDRHVGSFAGFFPADNPRFAMVVKLDNPQNTEWAESSAAPTFGEIARWLLSYYRIAPTR